MGDRINPHYLPDIVERLIIDIRLLPLWTNVYRDQFGHGRVPASSASVESKFSKLKSLLLKNCPLLRIDAFVQKHVDYLHGILKIANVQDRNVTVSSVDTTEILIRTPIKESNPEINLSFSINNEYIACKNDDTLSGAHVC